jgi:hypothetical protein
MRPKSLWQYYINTIIVFLDIIHRSEIGTNSVDWAELIRFLPEDGDRIQSTKSCVLNKKKDGG